MISANLPVNQKQTLHRPRRSAGVSLLEVVLALAILAMASAYLSQSMQLATTNALKSVRLTEAELVAESVMNQVIAGLIPAEPTQWTNYQNSAGQTEWMYQIQNVQTEVEYTIGLQIAVQKRENGTAVAQASFDLFANRWIIDPELGLDTPPEEEADAGYGGEATGAGGGTGGGAGGAAGGTGGATGGQAAGGAGGFPGGFPGGAGGFPGGGRGGAGGPGAGGGRGGAGGGRGGAGAGGPGGGRGGAGGGPGGGRGGAGGQPGGGRGGGAPGGGGGPGGGRGGAGGGARGGR